jgi:hypothetical protein
MRKNWTFLSGIVATVAMTTAVQAVPISGTISMGGQAVFDSSDFTLATTVTSWPLVYVAADSGSFGSITPGISATVNMGSPWIFAPSPGVALNNLWNIDGFQFDFTSDTVVSSASFINIYGYGTISGNGFDTTDFEWNLEGEVPSTAGTLTQFTVSATAQPNPNGNGNTVPDGGFTVALLGLALAGMEGLRRKLSKA